MSVSELSVIYFLIIIKVNDGLHKGVYEGEGVLTCKSQTVHHDTQSIWLVFKAVADLKTLCNNCCSYLPHVSVINYSDNNFTINKIERQVPLHSISLINKCLVCG